MTLGQIIDDAKKAVAALTTIEGTAVALGFLHQDVAAYVTAALGAVAAAVVYLAKNIPAAKK